MAVSRNDKCLRDSLVGAIEVGDFEGVKECLRKGAKFNYLAPLPKACANGHVKIAEILIDSGEQVNKADTFGRTALQRACANGHLDVAKLLIDSGARVNKAGMAGLTALQEASINGHLDVAKVLIDSGAQVNEADMYDGRTALQEACSHGHLDVAKLLIDSGAEVNKADEYGRTALQGACANGHLDVAKLLIDSGVQVNEAGTGGLTALQEAFINGHLDVGKLLLDSGAQVNEANEGGLTALRGASINGFFDVAKLLIDSGAQVNEADEDGFTPLQGACSHGHLDVAKLLIDSGAEVNKADKYGRTALQEAFINGHLDVGKLLLDSGAQVNEAHTGGLTALRGASINGLFDVAKLLIDSGAQVNEADEDGFTPLQGACSHGHLGVAKLLIESGAQLNKADEYGRTALREAFSCGHLDVAKLLIGSGAQVNEADEYGLTALQDACANGLFDVAKLLIDSGAQVNEPGRYGLTALQNACATGHLDVAKLLIDSGAQVNEPGRYGHTALQNACATGHLDVAKLLIDSGAQVNKADEFGRTALQGACANGHLDVANLLIDSGAQVNEAGRYGGTALQGSCVNGHLDVAKLLIDSGARVNEAGRYGRTALQGACENGHLDVAKHLIDSGAQVNKADEYRSTALHRAQVNEAGTYGGTALQGACENGHLDVAKLLIDSGAQVNEDGFTPLFSASFNCHLDVAKLLINAGALVNEGDETLSTALYEACQTGRLEMSKYLIYAGADVNKMYKVLVRFMNQVACLNGHLDVAKFLLDAGADVTKIEPDEILFSGLRQQCRTGRGEIIRLLLHAGANLIFSELFENACEWGHVEIAKVLLGAGVDVKKTEIRLTPLLLNACWEGYADVAELLINAGADVNETVLESEERTVFMAACSAGHVEIAKVLIEAGADVTMTDIKGNSALLLLAKNSHKITALALFFDLVKLILLKEPTLIERRGEDGLLPHEIQGRPEVRKFFLDAWIKYRYAKLYSQGTTKQTKIKVCVIGKAEAGKTTLIKTLKNIYWKNGGDDKRTAGMDVSAAKIKSAGDVVFCDFAGQEFFHKTHGLFFSESTTVFLLVVDLTKDENELKTWSHYFCSFVKCSVVLNEKANFVVVGSKRDLLPIATVGETKLQQVFTYLRLNFGPWFNFYKRYFVLNCRDRKSSDLDLLREAISEVKALTIKAAQEVPIIVEAATASFLPTLRHPFTKRQSVLDKVRLFFSADGRQKEEIHTRTMSVLENLPETGKEKSIHLMELSIFKDIMAHGLYPGLTVEVQKLLTEFLQGIGEILVIEDRIILDPTWLCHNIIGPLLSPLDSEFPVSLVCSPPGTTTKDDIQSALEAFNRRKWENIDETIRLLCHLEICYELPSKQNTYQFPALLEEKRPSNVWSENSGMTIYVGRRVRRAEETDIITPGTMPFLQCHVRNVPCFHGLDPVVWQDGLIIRDKIDDVLVEGLITLQEQDKALDFVVRGPVNSERECLKLLNNLMKTGKEILRKRSPGTESLLWYISSTELKQLKEFPLAYEKATINEKIETSTKSSASVSKGMVIDSLRDLLALGDNHIDYLSCNTLSAIIMCLEKDDAALDALKGHLPGLSNADQIKCNTAEELFSTWSKNVVATTHCFAIAARRSNLPYLLALLSEDGAIELSADETIEAKEDLAFIRTNSPSTIKRRRVEQATGPLSALSTSDDEEISSLFDEDYLDEPLTGREIFRAAERIQPVWNLVGRVLGPEPFQRFQLHAFGEKKNDHERALDMLDAWANQFGRRATRRHFIASMRDVGYLKEVASIFSGPQ
ncbi:uncharacterized protein [Oscarella lobularis]|uniref:uncharacterized protein isoform X3 n=1 Tax=Oscarella lobularis TaxID=121494 RepID=UPI00331381DB